MKQKLLFLICMYFSVLAANSQVPQAIPYQAIARDNTGNLIINQNISLRFSIHDETAMGLIVYQETQNVLTNQYGLINVNIGQGTVITGPFSNINWNINSKFMQVEIDVAGGNTYVDLGTQQLMSVPYALNGVPAGRSNGEMLFWNGTNWVSIPPGSTGETLVYCNGAPMWGICLSICNQVWMPKNLEVITYRNGDTIPEVTDPVQWAALTTGAWCYYNNDPANGAIYGKLYNWYAVNDPRGLAPTGWHIPTKVEWNELENCLGGPGLAGGKMKEAGTTHWANPNTNATNSSGFNALPGGNRNVNGVFLVLTNSGRWWTNTEFNSGDGWFDYLLYSDGINYITSSGKTNGFSIRCIRD